MWYSDVENINSNNILTAELTPYRIFRFLFGVKSSPFTLSATLQKHIMTYKHTDPYFTEKLLKSLHVGAFKDTSSHMKKLINSSPYTFRNTT